MVKAVVVHKRRHQLENQSGGRLDHGEDYRSQVAPQSEEKERAASSVVVYLHGEVFLGPEACVKMSGKRHPYQWRV